MKHFIILLISLISMLGLHGQSVHLHVGANTFVPLGNDVRRPYPALGYDSDQDPSFLLGGFGAGVSYFTPLLDQVALNVQVDVNRTRYYDGGLVLLDNTGNLVGALLGITTRLQADALAMSFVAFDSGKHFWIGTGLGARGVFSTRTRYSGLSNLLSGEENDRRYANNYSAPLVVVLPLALRTQWGRFSFGIRGEWGLTNMSRLSFEAGQRDFMLTGELGFRIWGEG